MTFSRLFGAMSSRYPRRPGAPLKSRPAAGADDALEAAALVLAAVALPVLGGTEDLLAEEAVLLRLQRAVVDRLRLLDLAVGPRADRIGRGPAHPPPGAGG